MKKNTLFIVMVLLLSGTAQAQNKTDASLMWNKDKKQVLEITSESGNLYREVGHHGPAVENEWMGLRLYFDHKVAIDTYNKINPGLELAAAGWYPTVEQQQNGWGADLYKVGSTVGMGGVRLWDGEKEQFLDPVSRRTARVHKEANHSYMEMLSEGIPYKGETIDVLVRVTVYSGMREAKVEAFAFSNKPVQFLTGINFHPTTEVFEGEDFIATWGVHPEDVAAFQFAIGGAIKYNPDDFEQVQKGEAQFELVSKPTKYLETWVTSSCEKEADLNTMGNFIAYLRALQL